MFLTFINEYIKSNFYEDCIQSNYDNKELIKEIKDDICYNIYAIHNIVKEYEEYMIYNMVDNITNKLIRLERLKNTVSELQKLELPEQRTQEWYDLRKGLLTASSLSTALGEDYYKSRDELILEKVLCEEKPFLPNPITEWGVKYEEIATKFYEYTNDVKIVEFGLIPHPEFKIFGASPDGICSNDSPDEFVGRMLEIKCPPKRKFSKNTQVPKSYWCQMQGQLACCDLEECDFLQVKLLEYKDFDDYKKDIFLIDNVELKNGFTTKDLPKGCTLSYRKPDELKLSYLYPEIGLSDDEYLQWIQTNKDDVKAKGYEYVESKWWKIDHYACSLVKRDRDWWITAMDKIHAFWSDVEKYKQSGLHELKQRVENKSFDKSDISNVTECLI